MFNQIKRLVRRFSWVNACAQWVRTTFGRLLMRLFHALAGVRPDAVLFSSYAGTGYSDNCRYISEALHALRPDIRIEWQFLRGRVPGNLPDYIRVVHARSLGALRAYSTARVFVDNMNRPDYMLKFPDQRFVQTWHGDRGFKRVMLDMDTDQQFSDGKYMDLAVSGSDFGTRVYRSAFGYGGEVLECGCPRNDLLVANPPGAAARVRAKLGLPGDARVLLYAPTFRDGASGKDQASPLSLRKVAARLEQTTGEKWVCVSRGHKQVRGVASDALMDVSGYPEVGELLLACDMVITDYSSIGGDFMLLNRPVVYFQPDRADYDAERGLYFDPDRSPLLTAHSEAELLALLSRPIDGPANCRAVLDFFGTHESGRAAETVARRISEWVGPPRA